MATFTANARGARFNRAATPNPGLTTAPNPSTLTAGRADPCADPCPPRCPACGGLECLCRPRFFPGQLLTDRDLNLLTRYVVEKNRLHNRSLHGWGVAGGLEVCCDPCDPQQVIVRTGHAMARCGDDIVVCADQVVNLCELIDACTPRTSVCDPPYDRTPKDCLGGTTRWVLAICYDETPSRGLTALLGAADSACKRPCACGGASGCTRCGGSGCGGSGGGGGCGCGGKGWPGSYGSGFSAGSANTRRAATSRKDCEPTQVCEGYRFIAYPAPDDTPTPLPGSQDSPIAQYTGGLLGWAFENRARLGPLMERLLCCLGRAHELLGEWGHAQKIEAAESTKMLYTAYYAYAEAIQAFATEFTVQRCTFVAKVGRLYDNAIAFRNNEAARLEMQQVEFVRGQLVQFDDLLMEMVSECFCAALLPPAPAPQADNCVPLAVVTMNPRDCRVQQICNWQARKLLITWRSVGYWLSWLPWHCLQEQIARFCCGAGNNKRVLQLIALFLGVSVLGANCGRKPAASSGHDFHVIAPGNTDDSMLHRAMASPTFRGAFNPVLSELAARHEIDVSKLDPKLTLREIGNPTEAAAAGNLMSHLLGQFEAARTGEAAAPGWFKLAARLVDGSLLEDSAEVGGAGGVAEMRAQVAALSQVVAQQQAQIDRLLKVQPNA